MTVADTPSPTNLGSELQIVPLGYEQIDQLTRLVPGERLDGFMYLSVGLEAAILRAVDGMMIGYVETDYVGGTGAQGAAVFADGAVTFRAATPIRRGPAKREDPVNTALRHLGVMASPQVDEFDTLGLGRYRNLESLGL